MERTLQTLISERGDAFVGRDAERGFLLGLLDDAGPAVAFVCGIAGVGKSALLRAFAADAQAAGATVLAVEGESTEPTEAGFLRALSGA
ncbi:MAG TPA: AAA family ATPase, partial [Capillimicrobium sp.]|nr:AAA family ATPase [Capillimicrobium sp.]